MERPAPVYTANAPAPGGPYSQAMLFANLVFAAGQLGLDPATGEMVAGSTAAQAERALLNLSAVLTTAGSSLGELIKTTIFLTDMDDFPAVNEVYERLLGHHRPARSTVAVAALPKGALVEIEGVAARS